MSYVGVYFCLTPLILVDLLGADKLSNAYGFVLLLRGAGVIAGPPFAGLFYHVFIIIALLTQRDRATQASSDLFFTR